MRTLVNQSLLIHPSYGRTMNVSSSAKALALTDDFQRELNSFNVARYQIRRKYVREYHKHFPVSAPEEDYEDRNRLYFV